MSATALLLGLLAFAWAKSPTAAIAAAPAAGVTSKPSSPGPNPSPHCPTALEQLLEYNNEISAWGYYYRTIVSQNLTDILAESYTALSRTAKRGDLAPVVLLPSNRAFQQWIKEKGIDRDPKR